MSSELPDAASFPEHACSDFLKLCSHIFACLFIVQYTIEPL